MIKEIGSFKFAGFYESILCDSDEFIDFEMEDQAEVDEIVGKDQAEVVWEYDDFNEFKIDTCKEFMKQYVEGIHDVLPYDITDHEDFKFEILDGEDNIEIISPKYYNYSTDRCFCLIETNRKTLKLIKEYTLRLDGVEQYIKDHFTSCDGFISFITNDFNEWKTLDIEDYEENMFIALLDMLLELDDKENIFNIHLATIDNVCKYCYATPYVYYNNKKYALYDFKEKFDKE